MSVKTRASLRLAKHLAFAIGLMAIVYMVFLAVPVSTFLMILGGAGTVFFGYQLFKIYVTMEEMAENRSKRVDL